KDCPVLLRLLRDPLVDLGAVLVIHDQVGHRLHRDERGEECDEQRDERDRRDVTRAGAIVACTAAREQDRDHADHQGERDEQADLVGQRAGREDEREHGAPSSVGSGQLDSCWIWRSSRGPPRRSPLGCRPGAAFASCSSDQRSPWFETCSSIAYGWYRATTSPSTKNVSPV